MKNISSPFLIRDELGNFDEFSDYASAMAAAKEAASEGAKVTLYAAQLDFVPMKKYRTVKYETTLTKIEDVK